MRKNRKKQEPGMTRRDFIGAAAAATVFSIVPRHVLGGSGHTPPSDRVNMVSIGVGGNGAFKLQEMAGWGASPSKVSHIGFCDVDPAYAAKDYKKRFFGTFPGGYNKAKYPGIYREKDWRKLFEQKEKDFDAVFINTPDHTHMAIASFAIQMGKHVFCEKPMGQNILEVRTVTELAKQHKAVTQTGNTNHFTKEMQCLVQMIKKGEIGKVRDVYIWCDNEWEPIIAPKAYPARKIEPYGPYNPAYADLQAPKEPIPEGMDWDLWLGPAPHHPFSSAYHPLRWRSWWSFGNGRLGDIGCHSLDPVHWALDLRYPSTVRAYGPGRAGLEKAPPWLVSKWTYSARGDMPPVTLHWYDGNKRPEEFKELCLDLLAYEEGLPGPLPDLSHGILFVGENNKILLLEIEVVPPRVWQYDGKWRRVDPEEEFPDLEWVDPWAQWYKAIHDADPAATWSPFSYCGPLTEAVLLGTAAYRAGNDVQRTWDSVTLKSDSHAMDRFIRPERRKGWAL